MRKHGFAASMARYGAPALFAAALGIVASCSSSESDGPVVQVALPTSEAVTAPTTPAADAVGDTVGQDPADPALTESEVDPTPTPLDLPTGPPPTSEPLAEASPPTAEPELVQPTPESFPERQDVPSDELEVTVPSGADDGPPTVSDGTALACAATEEAIEFVDFGDVARVSEALDAAAAHAFTAAEPDVAAQAEVLAGFDGDLDSAFDIIVSTLNVCSRYGYEV